MKTLFTAAPFERFELGAQKMGQEAQVCRLGTMPVNQGGRIICVPYSPPSGMFLPAWPGGTGNVGYGPAMGQFEDPYLTQAERDQLMAQIQGAVSKVKPLDNIIAWSADNDPQLKNYLGNDWTRFFALSNSIAPLYKTVAEIADRMAQTDAEYWYRPSAQELADVKQWTTGVNEMYKILEAHKTPAKPLPVTAAPPPSIAPMPGTTMPKGGALTSKGLSTKDYLIGAGAAIGLGLLLYKIVGG